MDGVSVDIVDAGAVVTAVIDMGVDTWLISFLMKI